MKRYLIYSGLILIAAGLLWPWISKLPVGRLPGDIVISRPNFRFYFPITTMILLSVLLSFVLWLFKK